MSSGSRRASHRFLARSPMHGLVTGPPGRTGTCVRRQRERRPDGDRLTHRATSLLNAMPDNMRQLEPSAFKRAAIFFYSDVSVYVSQGECIRMYICAVCCMCVRMCVSDIILRPMKFNTVLPSCLMTRNSHVFCGVSAYVNIYMISTEIMYLYLAL